ARGRRCERAHPRAVAEVQRRQGLPHPGEPRDREGHAAADLRLPSLQLAFASVKRSFGIVVVAFAAALWGLDALIRGPLASTTTPATIVFGEHLVLVVLTLPLAAGAARARGRSWRGPPFS